jgi:putative transposase
MLRSDHSEALMTAIPSRRRYPTDLTDAQWHLLEPLLTPNTGPGRPTTLDLREIVNALLYLKQAGCAWRLLPHDFPNWTTVRYYFDKWTLDGTWDALNTALREQVRQRARRHVQPSAAIVDSQSVKTVEVSRERGWEGYKRLVGRKRHVLVDTQGCLLGLLVLAADVADQVGGLVLLALCAAAFPLLTKLWADQAYRGPLEDTAPAQYGITVDIVAKPPAQDGFVILPKRWIVERTLAWLSRGRRLKLDYERDPAYSEAWIYVASIHRMLKHLAPDPSVPKPYQRAQAA